MSVFGPQYPPELQRAVDGAEQLAQMFTLPEGGDRLSETWAIGRATEIERFVEAVAEDWRAGHISELAAANSINAYIGGLHGGLCERMGLAAASGARSSAGGVDDPPTWT
jgi:hypothetical protein